jgi:hypothetical protein
MYALILAAALSADCLDKPLDAPSCLAWRRAVQLCNQPFSRMAPLALERAWSHRRWVVTNILAREFLPVTTQEIDRIIASVCGDR